MIGNILLMIISLITAFFAGYFFRKSKLRKVQDNKNSIENEEIQQQKEKYQKTKKAFNELMEYDYDSALGGGNKE